jgi:citronellol/citronellal dehydrogenase|tara:strand:- start:11721 stop:12560 length:840 start_codon:yes stop_codon:yes gene_type:complete
MSLSLVGANEAGCLAGRVAVITGASRGIGEAIAYRFAQAGAKVVVSARTLSDGDHVLAGGISNVVATIERLGGQALAVRADIGLAEHREHLIDQAESTFGPIDILVNNAAVTYFERVRNFQKKHFDLMFRVQVEAPFALAQSVLPGMIERRQGAILNVSSHAARHPAIDVGGRGGTVYGMCKAALERFSTGLASEVFDQGIAVNVISPGLVATPGVLHHNLINEDTPADRVTPIEHMAEACLRLVHGDPRRLTGLNTYADDVMKQFNLAPQTLPPLHGV